MTIQQLLAQYSVEDIVRTTMAVHDIDELRAELDLPPESPEEKAKRQLEMRYELFRNKQRTYHALRRYGVCAKEVAEDGSDVVEGE